MALLMLAVFLSGPGVLLLPSSCSLLLLLLLLLIMQVLVQLVLPLLALGQCLDQVLVGLLQRTDLHWSQQKIAL